MDKEEIKEEMIELETILVALDDKIHRVQELLVRERKRFMKLKEKINGMDSNSSSNSS